MSSKEPDRREFLQQLVGGLALASLDWSVFPHAASARTAADRYDAVIIGSGLGGLSCAAAFARRGFRPLVLEKHDRPGGYATSFSRPGGFVFDVSLHSTTVGERNGIHDLIGGFPEISDVEFVPHPNLYRAVFPRHDLRIPQKNLQGTIDLLGGLFPEEAEGVEQLFADMKGLTQDIQKLVQAGGQVDMTRFPTDFPHLFQNYARTWGQMVDARIRNPELKAIVSSQWGYYGLPPSKLAALYYAMPAIGYMEEGGYYPRGRSQDLSNAFVGFIEREGGTVLLNTQVEKILVEGGAAVGVRTKDGKTYKSRAVVSNANAYDTCHSMLDEGVLPAEYLARLDEYSVSLSSFQVFLGLKEDLVGAVGIEDSEIFIAEGYDDDAAYAAALAADVETCNYGLTLYDKIFPGYSPTGKNTLNIIALQGYEPWEKYAQDYRKGQKGAYKAEKQRLARVLIERVEKRFLPGLSRVIEVQEIGTPLTNVRYTGNYRGAIYGWEQTLNNSGASRLPHKTPLENLFLTGAWTRPGHGYSAVIWSGIECFREITQTW